ncbi:citrulline utilization hydrolase CtlX [Povalibacter sp.]|uniref:citrulline utilization hydrolase CtlX n=1 Tax=Povalibacter sp. TaxID=1962978 RepID=UPI002F3FDD5A
MIRPARFAGNVQTAASNRFQRLDDALLMDASQAAALPEFDELAQALRSAGVNVHVVEDTPEPHTPDSIFPNNWVSFHADGTVVLYPMMAPNRRLERRLDIIETLDRQHGFHVARTVDLAHREAEDKFLEGTGSLVLDRVNRIAYACLSPRTDMDVLGEFSQRLDYDIVAFEAFDAAGAPIYHTNVLMSVGSRSVAICAACIEAPRRAAVLDLLRASGRSIVDLTLDQMQNFAGNMLELRSQGGEPVIAMSQSALSSLDAAQIETLTAHGERIVSVPIPTIERLGGGSVRCMIAEVHLPQK